MTRSKKPQNSPSQDSASQDSASQDGASHERSSKANGDQVQDEAVQPSAGRETGDEVAVGPWKQQRSVVRRAFPGPPGASAPLRVAFERRAFADVVAHAKESLDAEICGVLVGTPCRDDVGDFVHVDAAIRGSHAEEGTTQVTFTQATWNAIHETIRTQYPKLQMVGWYHSHPGFGVEFSEMDVFIQQNFFAGNTQIGLLMDPLSGDAAMCINAAGGIRYVPRFWVDAREHRCRVPTGSDEQSSETRNYPGVSPEVIAELETRINQLIHAVDDMRQVVFRWIYALGILLGMAMALFMTRQVSYMIFGDVPEPPQHISLSPVPVNIDGKACLLGVQVVSWQIPPELIAVPVASEEDQAGESAETASEGKSQRANDATADGPTKKGVAAPGAASQSASPKAQAAGNAGKGK